MDCKEPCTRLNVKFVVNEFRNYCFALHRFEPLLNSFGFNSSGIFFHEYHLPRAVARSKAFFSGIMMEQAGFRMVGDADIITVGSLGFEDVEEASHLAPQARLELASRSFGITAGC